MANQTCDRFPLKKTLLISCGTVLGLGVVNTPVFAALSDTEGLNEVQTATAVAIQTICPQMATLNGSGSLTSEQQQLFFRCRELVQTANELEGATTGIDNSLGLTSAELAEALQRVAPEEAEIMGAGATDTSHDQLINLSTRLQVLRTGIALGGVSGLAWNIAPGSGGAAGNGDYSRLSAFINGIYGTGDKDSADEEDGFDYDAFGVTAGVDYQFSDNLIGGVALGLTNSDVEVEDNLGEYDTDGLSVSLYGTYYVDAFYVEGTLTVGSYDYEGSRNISYGSGATAVNEGVDSDTDGDQFAYSIAAGYNHSAGATNIHVYGRVQGVDADIDAYEESGSELAMRVEDQSIESLQIVLGGQVAYTVSQDFGVVIPYIGWEQHYETDDEERELTTTYIFDPTDTSFTFETLAADEHFSILSLGTSVVLQQGRQFFINFDTVLGLEHVSSHTLTAGARFEF